MIADINDGIQNRLVFGWLLQFIPGLVGLTLMVLGLSLARSEFVTGGHILQAGGYVVVGSVIVKLTVSLTPGMNRRSRWVRLLAIGVSAGAVFFWQFFNRLNIVPGNPQVAALGVLLGIALMAEVAYLATELSGFFGWLQRRSV